MLSKKFMGRFYCTSNKIHNYLFQIILENQIIELRLKLLPGAVEIAMQENVDFRKGLPVNYLLNNGVAYDQEEVSSKYD
jgi:hypothetical protein